MKYIKQVIWTILILMVVGIVFRGWIFRNLVTYDSIGMRESYSVTEDNLAKYIDAGAKGLDDPEIHQVIKLALSLTSNHLNFTAEKNDNNPNQLIESRTAHCVGYAHFFTTTCNYLLEKQELSDNWIAIQQIGQLNVFGQNIHKYFNHPFLKDHDFVIIENKLTGEILAVDPTINDYFKINFISFEK